MTKEKGGRKRERGGREERRKGGREEGRKEGYLEKLGNLTKITQ